jgi:isopenicillin-N epimerase
MLLIFVVDFRFFFSFAAHMLADAWKTRLMFKDEVYVSMAVVEIPSIANLAPSSENAAKLHHFLRDAFQVEVPVLFLQEKLWVRISAQIYLELSDFRPLADGISKISAKGDLES